MPAETENNYHLPDGKQNYYAILGVTKGCTEAQLKKAYKKLAIKLHPDKNPNDPDAQANFARLNEAFSVLSDPVKKIDYDKDVEEDQDLGWGWNPAMAKRRAEKYNADSSAQFFSMGNHLNAKPKETISPETVSRMKEALRFWSIAAVIIAVLEILMTITAVQIGAIRMCVIWVTLLGSFFLLGLLLSYKTDDWSFPLGSCVLVTSLMALIGGIVGGDALAQSFAYRGMAASGVDPSELPAKHLGIFQWTQGTVVDRARTLAAVAGSTGEVVCLAPIVAAAAAAAGNYSLDQVSFWAAAAGCCSLQPATAGTDAAAGLPTCAGWAESWSYGINWFMPSRPTRILGRDNGPARFRASLHDLYAPLIRVNGSQQVGGPVLVEWVKDAPATISMLFDGVGYGVMMGLALLWPAGLAVAFVFLSLFSCLFIPRMRCGYSVVEWLLYLCQGLPGWWGECF